MSTNIYRKYSLAMISDTAFSGTQDKYLAFEPVVREIEEIAPLFKSIEWIGYKRYTTPPANHKMPTDKSITMSSVYATGGNKFRDKISILIQLPAYLSQILYLLKKNNVIYSRGPSTPALLVIILSLFFKNKIYLHKYAGGWDLKPVPFSYAFQRWLLKKQKRGHVIIATALENDSNFIVPLPNPCLTADEVEIGYLSIKSKIYSNGLRICFVGRCIASKGIFDVLNTLNRLANDNILGNCTIVGNSRENELRSRLNKQANQCTTFAGILSRHDLNQVYADSHIILHPSRSEGFPKVLAEAAAFGCVPVVSNLPGIDKILQNNVNGIILENLHIEKIVGRLLVVWSNNRKMRKMACEAHHWSKQFSYEDFLKSIIHLLTRK